MSLSIEAPDAPRRTFPSGRVILLGRDERCDVALRDPSVSERHAQIVPHGREYVVIDLGSTNGTFVGEIRLERDAPRLLRTGDRLRLGRVALEVTVDPGIPPSDRSDGGGHDTQALVWALVSRVQRENAGEAVLAVRVVEGPDLGLAFPLKEEGARYVIGRAPEHPFRLSDRDVSRAHVSVCRKGNSAYVSDLGSKNGTLLGAAVLTEREAEWPSDRMLRVGRTVLALQPPAVWSAPGAEDVQAPEYNRECTVVSRIVSDSGTSWPEGGDAGRSKNEKSSLSHDPIRPGFYTSDRMDVPRPLVASSYPFAVVTVTRRAVAWLLSAAKRPATCISFWRRPPPFSSGVLEVAFFVLGAAVLMGGIVAVIWFFG